MENEIEYKKPKGKPTTVILSADNHDYVTKHMHWKFSKEVNLWLDSKRLL